jgi:anaerobic selenocysteine-containing dehydrogenase
MSSRYNSGGHALRKLQDKDATNPAFVHPEDLAQLGLEAGDLVWIRSARSSIPAVVRPDDTLRRGLVSMTHAWGDAPDRDGEVRTRGGPTARLSAVDDAYDPYSGQPVMSNIPVALCAIPDSAAAT